MHFLPALILLIPLSLSSGRGWREVTIKTINKIKAGGSV
jgi:hypothetical protein